MRLRSKILIGAVPMTMIFAGLSAFSARRASEALMLRNLARRLEPQLESSSVELARDWSARRSGAVNSGLDAARGYSGAVFAEILTLDGTVAAHSGQSRAGVRRDDPGALAAMAEDGFLSVRAPGPTLILSTPLRAGPGAPRLGTLRLAMPITLSLNAAREVGSTVAAIAAAFCGLTLLLLLMFVRGLVLKPVERAVEATRRLAGGDYTVKVPEDSGDELGELAGAFNHMSGTLSRTFVLRDRLEEALAIARTIIESSADGILVVDPNLRVIMHNRRFIEMWSVPEEAVRTADVRLMAEAVKHQLVDEKAFMDLAATPHQGDEERRDILKLKDGRVFERISQVYRIGEKTLGRMITTHDMTLHFRGLEEIAKARDEAQRALEVARATLDASADGTLVVGHTARIVTFNKRFLELWNIPEELAYPGVPNTELIALVLPQVADAAQFARAVVRSDADFAAPEIRDILHLKDGRVFERVSRPYLIGGRALGRTLTFRDLTLHFEGLRALSQARDEALEAARVKSQFLANVSHELRTPLNAVVAGAELLRGTKLNPEQSDFADTVQRAARTLLSLVDSVLDLSKIEAGRMTVERTTMFPGELLQDAAALVGQRAAEKRLVLRVEPGEAASEALLGDPTRVRQVLLNLVSNAVKFTSRGEVVLGADVVSRGSEWTELEFSVRDTGIGISAEQKEKLFSPFTQGDGSTTRRYGGTGLGLAISRSLVELMGGTIGLDSSPGQGSRFWFRLKLDKAQSPRSQTLSASVPAPAARRDRLRVLIVEDNEINRRLVGRQLARLGCPSVAVGDGRAALDLVAGADFGLILLDCQMPDMDGYETARQIRRLEGGRKRTPIVAFTANAGDEHRRLCADAGMDDFVTKPATQEALSAVLERWDRPFDKTALDSFAQTAADDPRDLARILSGFHADAQARLASARKARDAGDLRSCAREAHTLKGAALTVGARGLAELCRRIEAAAAARAGEDELDSLLAQADAEAARVRSAQK